LLFSQPWALMDVGFQLSAGCVALLMLAGSWPADEFAMRQEAEPHAVVSAGAASSFAAHVGRGCRAMAMRVSRVLRDAVGAHVQAQWVALWGLTPWVLGCLGSWGWASWWVNLVCLPFLTLVTTPLALLGLFHSPAWAWAEMSLRPLSACLEAYQPTPQAWWMPAGLSGVHVALAVMAGAMAWLGGTKGVEGVDAADGDCAAMVTWRGARPIAARAARAAMAERAVSGRTARPGWAAQACEDVTVIGFLHSWLEACDARRQLALSTIMPEAGAALAGDWS
jgi:hypothetical protein